MEFIEILKSVFFGIVEGVTEWLPISSTGHMILLDEFISLDVRPEFMEMFLVVIQLGAIMAVVVHFWKKIFPFSREEGIRLKPEVLGLWAKVIVACLPAAVIGLLFDDLFNEWFYSYQTVVVALIVGGIVFLVVEAYYQAEKVRVSNITELTYRHALLVGFFQLLAAIFPGTSRSGATIIGGMTVGLSRSFATEFTFLLAIPVMFGASLLKLIKFNFAFTSSELMILSVGMVTAFFVSRLVIKFLIAFVRKNDFKIFAWYRILLGVVLAAYFFLI